MEIRVRFFASLVDRTGCATEQVQLPASADVNSLWRVLVQRHPELARLAYRPAIACDLEYADWDRDLRGVEEVAFLPPVSGGSRAMILLQSEPIRIDELIAAVRAEGDGAVVLFLGTVRDHNEGRRVLHLEYQAYEEMARSEMRRLEAEARERFGLSAVALAHRTGRLNVGEVAVGIVVASPHRAEAFSACRFIIDALKKTVPIWKKEQFEGGEVWIEGPGADGAGPEPV